MANINLDNLVPYTLPSASWSDRHSTVALWWNDTGAPGIQNLQFLYGWAGVGITDSLLKWRIDGGNGEKWPDPVLKSRIFRPDKIIETDACGDVTITATASYPERNTLALEYELFNTGKDAKDISVVFDYPGKNVTPDWEGPFPPGRIVSIDNEPEGSWSTLFIHHEHGRQVPWVRDYVTGLSEGTTIELVCVADLHSRRFRLVPGVTWKFTVLMGFGLNRGRAKEACSKGLEKAAAGWTSDEETARWNSVYDKAPQLPEKYRTEKYERMYIHAISGLNSLFIRGDGGYTANGRIPWTTKNLLAIAFFWDTAFSCMGAREFDAAMCQEAIKCFVDNAGPRGSLPGTLCDSHRAGEGQAPVMAWAAWHTYKRSGDKAWLAEVFPGLCGYIRYWRKYHSSERGLCRYYNAGQIGDNDVRFDPVYGREQGNESLYGFDSPDLNAFMVVEMRCLGNMAEELGFANQASEWRIHADVLAKLIVEVFYFPEEAMFYDVKADSRTIFSGTKGPNMFLPLRCGVPLPKTEISRIVEGHMLNPDEFFRELPFPSVSYDNPEYDPNGYWRGRIWPHIALLMVQTLWICGYENEAEISAQRLLDMIARNEWYFENYHSETGEGPGFVANGGQIGFPEYNWTLSAVIQLLLEKYKEPVC